LCLEEDEQIWRKLHGWMDGWLPHSRSRGSARATRQMFVVQREERAYTGAIEPAEDDTREWRSEMGPICRRCCRRIRHDIQATPTLEGNQPAMGQGFRPALPVGRQRAALLQPVFGSNQIAYPAPDEVVGFRPPKVGHIRMRRDWLPQAQGSPHPKLGVDTLASKSCAKCFATETTHSCRCPACSSMRKGCQWW
jgi:hypothetical protein